MAVAVKLSDADLSLCQIQLRQSHRHLLFGKADRDDRWRLSLGDEVIIGQRPCGQGTDDFTLHNLSGIGFCFAGFFCYAFGCSVFCYNVFFRLVFSLFFFNLFTDHHGLPGINQPSNIAVCRMKRHACHRDGIALFIFATSGQGDAQNIGSKLGIIEKQLIEIAHPVQHQGMRIIRF